MFFPWENQHVVLREIIRGVDELEASRNEIVHLFKPINLRSLQVQNTSDPEVQIGVSGPQNNRRITDYL